MLRLSLLFCFSWVALHLCNSPCSAEFIIQVNYTGDQTYKPLFDDAALRWQSLIPGYRNGFVVNRTSGSSATIGSQLTTLRINASVVTIDGIGGVLGSAGPNQYAIDQQSFRLATDGSMQFDVADVTNLVNSGVFDDVILHEMAHVMGFGTMWNLNSVYTDGSGEFTGAVATSFWQSEFGQTGTPNVELGGSEGTRDGHWDEVNGGAGFTNIRDPLGRDMRYELMTGWLNNDSQGSPFISNMTLGSFVDIGYQANFQAVPEPSSLLFASMAGVVLLIPKSLRTFRKTSGNSG
ncbi:MAG: peptidase [Pirellula sp.]|nr:peptidase [Pirellula sp.]